MGKRKPSTFERLCNGKLQWNRKQRREVERRLNSVDPGLEIMHPHAAGIDVGNESHYYIVQLVIYIISSCFPLPRLLGMGCLVLLGCFDDALEVVRPLGPGERRRVLAIVLQVSKQKFLQVFLR